MITAKRLDEIATHGRQNVANLSKKMIGAADFSSIFSALNEAAREIRRLKSEIRDRDGDIEWEQRYREDNY